MLFVSISSDGIWALKYKIRPTAQLVYLIMINLPLSVLFKIAYDSGSQTGNQGGMVANAKLPKIS